LEIGGDGNGGQQSKRRRSRTTDQSPRWEGPEERRPSAYLPVIDNPKTDRNTAGENLNNPRKRNVADGLTRDDG